MVPRKGNTGKSEKDHGDNKQPVEVPLAQDGYHADDAFGAVVFAVPVVEDQAAGVDEEEAAGDVPVKRPVPGGARYDDRQHGGDIDPDEGQKEGLADGDVPEPAEDGLGEFWRRIENGQQGGEPKGSNEMGKVEEINDRTDHADQIKDDMECLMVVGPLDAEGGAGEAWGEVPMKVIAADGGKEDESQQMD